MKRLALLVLFALIAVAITAASVENASALPAFNKQFAETYKESPVAEAAKAQKCDLCHVPKEKKTERNEYGQALSKFVTKDDYKNLKDDKEALKEKIENAFTEAGKLKSAAGTTFAERMEAGELPASE